jgi:lipopolysaccharide heptosyltransferase II
MPGLQIYAPRERAIVAAADLALRPMAWMRRASETSAPVSRVLLLRLERIGDLLMVLPAIEAARAAWPAAEIDLAVGSWNLPLARLIPGLTGVHTADVPWLARDGRGDRWRILLAKARDWRRHRYDVVVNFEPDIRSNFLAWRTGARRRHGYWTGGGGAFLTMADAYAADEHVGLNARRLIAHAAGSAAPAPAGAATGPRLVLPDAAHARARDLLAGATGPIVGVHVSGGRPSKQWHLDRFAAVARDLSQRRGATIVLTGSEADRAQVDQVRRLVGEARIIDVGGALDLVELAAVLTRLDVLVTGDTGPMHLASAMATPLVALFGPADPRRYGPTSPRQHVLRVDLPCSPCGQVRLPPERCRGKVPDCMDGIQVERVVAAAEDLLDNAPRVSQTVTR